jgi:eukaryotic-like serine/threonine-protein kinase
MTARAKNDLEVGESNSAKDGAVMTVPTQTQTGDEPRPAAAGTVSLSPIDPVRYQPMGEFARGGLGRILKVRDLRIGRVVALKEMLRDTEGAYARFVREAMITARLEHPAIVPVHDVGRWPSGEPFYSMKLISGRSLHDHIRDTPALDGRMALLPNVIAVADAIAYAHSQGIIHRDVKPANVVVGAYGETVVIDWGLAKDVRGSGESAPTLPGDAARSDPEANSGDPALTTAGAVLGTPCYMPPEQARGQPVDERSDVYALGALLYEVLAGEPPYRGAAEPLAAVLAGPPAHVERSQPTVPRDLGAIVRKAMARDPADRYPSARELALDLRRFQTGRLVSAQVYSIRMLMKRWLRRYRAPVIVAAVALSILAAGGAVSMGRTAERDVARRRANQLVLTHARAALEQDATEALMWLRTYPEDGEDPVEARALAIEADSRGVARHVVPGNGFFTFTSDGHAWVGAEDGEHVDLYDVASGARIRRWPHHGNVAMVATVPDGRTLAIQDAGATGITLLDLETGRSRRLPGHPGPVNELVVSPDGKWIASGSRDGVVRLVPTGPGEERTLDGHLYINKLKFSRDGRWLFSMSAERTAAARLWQIDGTAARVLLGPGGGFDGDISPDGALVALAHWDGPVSLWSSETGEQVQSLSRHTGKPSPVAFSADGRWIASMVGDGAVLAASVAGERRLLQGHTGLIAAIAFSPDGTLIASAGDDGEVRLSRLDGGEDRVLGHHPGQVVALEFAADGGHLATRALTRIPGLEARLDARIWDVTTREQRTLRCHGTSVRVVAFSPDGRRLATGSQEHVCLWDPRTGEAQWIEGSDRGGYMLAFAPDGTRLASADSGGRLRLWDLGGCTSITGCRPPSRVLPGHLGEVWMTAFSPDGHWLAAASEDATVRLWDVMTGDARVLASHTSAVRAVTTR